MASSLDAPAIAELLREFARRAALRGGNPYRARAYARAAESLGALTVPLERLIREDRLREIPGVGEAIAGVIRRLHETGTHPTLETMREEFPPGILEMLSIPGLRPERVLKLHKLLGVASLGELEQAAREDRLKSVKGLGPALQAKILQGIETMRGGEGKRHLHRAALLRTAEDHLRRAHPSLKRITPAGAFRRGCEFVSDLSLVVEAKGVAGHGISSGSQLTIHLTDTARYGATLLHATGSQAHVEQLKFLAGEKGFVLDKAGLHRARKVIARKSEEEIYAALDFPFIEPELREGKDEIALALQGKLPRLVKDEDIRGILHAHTDRSDGANSLEVMAQETRKRGYSYFGIADHSKSAHYARGLLPEEIEAQHAEIDSLNSRYDGAFRIFKGIESDILADGSLDYPDDILARFDFVVASLHSRLRLPREEQTDRVLRAVTNPYTTILGHMTGRQLLRRPGADLDIEKILAKCAKHGVAIEINANPWRLDLDWRWHRRAVELGCILSINPDAHSIDELDLTHWGVEMARKGGVPAERVLNCLSLQEITKYLAERRGRPRRSQTVSRVTTPNERFAGNRIHGDSTT